MRRRRFGPRQRFRLAVIVTVVAVAYVVVPWMSRLIDGLVTYGPGEYEPKDIARMHWQRHIADPSSWSTEGLIHAGLFVIVALVWFLSASGGRPGGRWR